MVFTPSGLAKAVVNCSCNLLPTHLQPTAVQNGALPFVRPAALTTMDGGNAGFAGAKTCPTKHRG
jgi:hypothetical protein